VAVFYHKRNIWRDFSPQNK